MRRAFEFEQQSYGAHQGAQQQRYSMHQEEAGHSSNEYHNQISSGVKMVPSAAPVCFDSEFLKHNAIFNESHVTNDGWFGQNMHQKQSNGWSGSGFGSGTSSTSYYYHAASGAGSSSNKYLPAMSANSVLNAISGNGGALSNIVLMQKCCGSYETVQEVKYVPAATMRVQEVRYERSTNWRGDEDDDLQHCIAGIRMLSGFQRIEPKRRDFPHQIRRVWC